MQNDSSFLKLFKASAGSGKTYTLAKEYLKIVLLNPFDYNKILAVTFTKKATAEMKSRIIEFLSDLEKNEHSTSNLRTTIINEIFEEKAIDISAVFDKNVSTALQLILHDYSNFNISTIDSFFQSIIRSFAKELDLPIGMEVELDTESVLQHAVQAMLKEYKADKDDFSRWLEEYVFDLIEEDKSWRVENNINLLAMQLLKEEYQLRIPNDNHTFDIASYKETLVQLKKLYFNYQNKLETLTAEVQKKIEHDNLDLSLYFQGKKSIASFIKYASTYDVQANSYILKMLNGEPLFSKATAKDVAQANALTSAWESYIKPYITDVLSVKETQEQGYYAAEIVLKNIYALALLEFVNSKIKEYKSDKNLILISDTNQIVSLIAKHEEVPFIFEKSATFLKYILIDEFQDTSSLQWQGMLPLLLEILQNINGLVLIVGDPKQSIYRWRGGKMELIIDGVKTGLPDSWKNRIDKPLNDNFRSAKEIVEFNNAFFSTVKNTITLENTIFKEVLNDVNQGVKKNDIKGFVQCKWMGKLEDEDMFLLEILNVIQSQKSKRAYKDFAVLTRSNRQGALVANFLQQHNIPVVSAESLLLHQHLSVALLIAAIEYVLHSEEDFYAVKLNYHYAKFLKIENVEKYLVKQQKQYLFEEKIDALNRNKISVLTGLEISELMFTIMQLLQLDNHSDNYLLRFQDVVFNYVQKQGGSAADFLDYWEQKKEKLSIIPPEGIDAVTISTIHKSKGLQYPIVIVPYANWSMKPDAKTTIWLQSDIPPFQQLNTFPVEVNSKLEKSLFAEDYSKEIKQNYIDNINVLYVAFTRAEEQLYIFTSAAELDKGVENPQSVSKLLSLVIPQLALKGAKVEDGEFSFGEIEDFIKQQNEIESSLKMESVSFHDFKNEIQLKRKVEYNAAQKKGNIVHEILSKITQQQHIEKAIATTAKEEIQWYSEVVSKVISLFQQKDWFNPKWQQLNERDTIYKGNQLRADRILLSDKECVIVDYKTGAKENEHLKQMQAYKSAYTTYFNKPTTAFLLYTDTVELIEVR